MPYKLHKIYNMLALNIIYIQFSDLTHIYTYGVMLLVSYLKMACG